MEKDALWRKQITAFHEEDGGLGRARSRAIGYGVWGRIGQVHHFTQQHGMDMDTIFMQCSDKWLWSLENDDIFSVSSLRKNIDDQYLEQNFI